MPNLFFNNFNSYAEQSLIEDLVTESLSIYGHTVYYLPREIVKKDEIWSEDSLSYYRSAFEFDMYIKSYDSYEGDGTFLSKFNLEVRDQVTFTVSRRMFGNEIATQRPDIQRPREGDLVYSTMMKRIFVIKYVSSTAIYYQMGDLQTWDVVCEVWEYSNERFDTGIDEIDSIEDKYTVSNVYANTAYEAAMLDVFAQNQEFQEAGASILDWTTVDPFSEGSV
jgi:hypothetical protein